MKVQVFIQSLWTPKCKYVDVLGVVTVEKNCGELLVFGTVVAQQKTPAACCCHRADVGTHNLCPFLNRHES